jgi:ATP synthase protein I
MNTAGASGVAWRVLGWQGAITGLAAFVAFLVSGPTAALAAVYGGLVVAALPTFYFAWRVFSRRPDDEPRTVVGAFYRGEVGKFALTTILFVFGIGAFGEQFLPMILTYMAALGSYWVVLASESNSERT